MTTDASLRLEIHSRPDAVGTLIVLPDRDTTRATLTAFETHAGANALSVVVVRSPHPPDAWWTDRETADGSSAASRLLSRLAEIPAPIALVGVGVGGQGALTLAFDQPERFPVVAAVAPACDLSRWYDRDDSLQVLFESSSQARQWEAPLRLNPLRRPQAFWIGCDPRDEPCAPSAMRVTTKLSSSGIAVDSDLTSEIGDSRDEYAAAVAGRIATFAAERLGRIGLPILGG